jgi:hypothetical protein
VGNEQVALLRAGNLSAIDADHIADEIDDVGKSEQRELASRMAVLLAHLLKWQHRLALRGNSSMRTIAVLRKDVAYMLDEAPSLKRKFDDAAWLDLVWSKAVLSAANEVGLDEFPETCPWSIEQIMAPGFLPD